MSQFIIHPNGNGGVTLTIKTPEFPYSVFEAARKDVPIGDPFVIMSREQVPEDMTFFAAWEADFSNPDGYGIGNDAWWAEQASKEQA